MRLLSRLSAIALCCLVAPRTLSAQLEIGTWVRRVTASQPIMTMKIETCCGSIGRKLTYKVTMGGTEAVLTLSSKMDGSEAAVLMNGQPSGETMALKRVDAHHATNVLKMNGSKFGTSVATLSPDGKTLTVLSDFASAMGGNPAGKQTEVWIKQ
jgi:hypothetical protein